MNIAFQLIKLIVIFTFFTSCNYDYVGKDLSKKMIRDAIIKNKDNKSRKIITKDKVDIPPLPRLSKMIISPLKPSVNNNRLISFSVADAIPVKDILFELGRIADIEMDIDPSISGEVMINAKNRPIIEVIDRISKLANIRYEYNDGVMSFAVDAPYIKHYQVGFLPDSSLWNEVESNLNNIFSSLESETTQTKIVNNNTVAKDTKNKDVESKGSIDELLGDVGDKVENDITVTSAPNIKATITFNKPAGLITILANKLQHEAAIDYMERVNKYSFAQVLIEAKVVEVQLKDEFKVGIDWNMVNGDGSRVLTGPSGTSGDSVVKLVTTGNKVFGAATNFNVSFLERFGVVKAITSPRVIALNNQTASVSFEDNKVYFTVTSNTNTSVGSAGGGNNVNTVITATKNELPIGTSLQITPSIDLDREEITLKVIPKLSVPGIDAVDPSTSAEGVSLGNKVPSVKTRTIETTARIKSSDTLVIGGLMSEELNKNKTQVPILSSIPILGNLFKFTSTDESVKETVIFIKATIIKIGQGTNSQDKKIHDSFSNSVREF